MAREVTITSGFATISDHAQVLIDTHGAAHPVPLIEQAIGYLSAWGMSRYAHADIHVGEDGDMTALYRDAAHGPVGYAIGAVWQDGRFGFHS